MDSKLEKHGHFAERIWPDWGNTAWADMAGLGSIELMLLVIRKQHKCRCTSTSKTILLSIKQASTLPTKVADVFMCPAHHLTVNNTS